jgi:general L-amino acid transport system permease protein
MGNARPPADRSGPLGWLRANLFSTWLSTATTLLLAYLVVRAGIALIEWGIVNAIWSVPDGKPQACRDSKGIGACWAVIAEKYRFLLFGTIPTRHSGARP